MIDMSWTTTPALVAGVVAARPAAGACAAPAATPTAVRLAPVHGIRVPAVRLRALAGGRPFAVGERHIDDNEPQNKSTFGIHSPGRPLS